jgi:hypothetical protein
MRLPWADRREGSQDVDIMDIWEAAMAMQCEKALDIASISLYSVAALALSLSPWKTHT